MVRDRGPSAAMGARALTHLTALEPAGAGAACCCLADAWSMARSSRHTLGA